MNLLPCPRCGSAAEVVHASHIRCSNTYNCDCETRLGEQGWNRRTKMWTGEPLNERGEATRSWIPFTPDWKPPEEDVLFVTSTGMWFGWRDEAGNWFASFDDQIVCCDKDVMHWMAAPPLPICGTSPQEEK